MENFKRDEFAEMGREARNAAQFLKNAGTGKKNELLRTAADFLEKNPEEILAANRQDVEKARSQGLTGALIDRLTLNPERIHGMAEGVRQVAALPDPVGQVMGMSLRPNGLRIGRVRVPLGVVGIIFEARPNVTADVFALCLKTGNAAVLRGGKEALQSNTAIVEVLRRAILACGFPGASLQLVRDTSRESAVRMMKARGILDLLIPRGGAGLIRTVVENSTVPVIETGVGNCHIYVDADADKQMAASIVVNAKTQRPGVCNAAESLLVNRNIADEFVPVVAARLAEKQVEIRGDREVCEMVPFAVKAGEDDWGKEYLDLILSVRLVDDIGEAIRHIMKYGTGHSEAIVTRNYEHAQRFLDEVDAAAVYVNASTRFTDGYEFGYGAELGISTQKLHVRGPMGPEALTSIKYIVYGNGQIRN